MTSKPVSSLSATMIGHGESEAHRHAIAQNNYRQEGLKISQHIATLHPARRQKIMQVQYPTTITRLSSGNSEQNLQHQHHSSSATATGGSHRMPSIQRIESEKEFHNRRKDELKQEYTLNERKKRYNRSCGTYAVVSDILQGNSSSSSSSSIQEPLFPQKANHQQVLMITGKLTMPDANKIPPDVPRSKKWLGSDLGWQT